MKYTIQHAIRSCKLSELNPGEIGRAVPNSDPAAVSGTLILRVRSSPCWRSVLGVNMFTGTPFTSDPTVEPMIMVRE